MRGRIARDADPRLVWLFVKRRGAPAVNNEVVAVDEAALVAGEEERSVGIISARGASSLFV